MADERTFDRMDGQHRTVLTATLVPIILSIVLAVGGGAWAISSAMDTQARAFMDVQNQNEKRITALEVERVQDEASVNSLTLEVEKLREVEGDLAVAVQKSNDLMEHRR